LTNLVSGESDQTIDAGIYRPGSIGDYVWRDTDGDGIKDPTETGINGVTVLLKDASGNVLANNSNNKQSNNRRTRILQFHSRSRNIHRDGHGTNRNTDITK
jgi:hypothetical protein